MDQQESDRDWRGELDQGLKALFGPRTTYSLNIERPSGQIFLLGGFGHNKGMHQVTGPERYTLTVNVEIPVAEVMRNGSILTNATLHIEHGPTKIERYQDMANACYVTRVEYVTESFDNFLKCLKDKTWGKYEKEFYKDLEANLDDSD